MKQVLKGFQNLPDAAERLRQTAVGIRLSRSRFNNQAKFPEEVIQSLASVHHADPKRLRAYLTLISKDKRFSAVTKLMSPIGTFWKDMTYEWPVDGRKGVRVLRREQIGEFYAGMQHLLDDLEKAKAALNEAVDEIRTQHLSALPGFVKPSQFPENLGNLPASRSGPTQTRSRACCCTP